MHIVIILIVLVVIGYFFYSQVNSKVDNGAMEKLVSICRGDEARVERLINLEKKRAPNISLDEAVKRAIESYKRDQ